jgi:hypothetical protein
MTKKYITITNYSKFDEFLDAILKNSNFEKLHFFHIDLPLLFKIPVKNQSEFLILSLNSDIKKSTYMNFFKSNVIKHFAMKHVNIKLCFFF